MSTDMAMLRVPPIGLSGDVVLCRCECVGDTQISSRGRESLVVRRAEGREGAWSDCRMRSELIDWYWVGVLGDTGGWAVCR